jgi:large subunit ribosomal protein L19
MSMNSQIRALEEAFIRKDLPAFRAGDLIRVHERVGEASSEVEGKGHIQVFEGTVLQLRGDGNSKSFTVRKISSGIGVEKVFQLNSPQIAKIELVERGHVRRARLTYLHPPRKAQV